MRKATTALSPKERRVLACAALGDTAQGTATRLRVGIETVKTQRRIAREKLKAKSLAHAVALAFRSGELS